MLNNIIALMEMYLKIAFSSNRDCAFNNERITPAENGEKMAI